MRWFFALGPLLAISPVFAAGPSVQSFTGVSNSTTTGTITAWGGVAGTCSAADGTQTCNSCEVAQLTCTTAPLCACNPARIYDDLVVRVNLQRPSGVTGNARAREESGNSEFPVVSGTENNGGDYIAFRWGDICNKMGGGSCESFSGTDTDYTIKVYIDKDANGAPGGAGEETTDIKFKLIPIPADSYNVYGTPAEGVNGFTPYPGDEKIYVENLKSTVFPILGYGGKITHVRIYISDVDVVDADLNAPLKEQDLAVVDNGSNLDQSIVDGLENDKLYFFRLALLDEAKNLVQFFPSNDDLPDACKAPTASNACPYSATPSQVLGLLSKDFNCFIATAAYGTFMEPKLGLLREFRYKILLRTKWGLDFVKSYYHWGPYAARYISDKPVLRAVARGLLWPVFGFAYVALKWGFAVAVAATLAAIALTLGLARMGVRRATRRA